MRKEQTSHKNEHNTLMCFPLEPVFTRDKRRLPNFIDEPTSGLDPVSRDELLDILLAYTKDKRHTVLFSTHITPDLNKVADSITFINRGKLLYSGDKEGLTDRYFIVSGNSRELPPDIKDVTQNIKMYPDSFEALVSREKLSDLSGLQIRHASIDDIIVFVSKGEV